MKKRLLWALILAAYSVILIKVVVFKEIPLVRIGSLMLNFGGTNAGHAANFVPFSTILLYLLGGEGLLIAGFNLVGNVILLVPMGFLVPFVYRDMTWKKSVVLAIATGLIIEVMQAVLRVGIFDIDDVILNAVGVMVGYFMLVLLAKWVREKKYVTICITAILLIVGAAAALYAVYPNGQQSLNPGAGTRFIQGSDLCGGTGGNGEIISVENNAFTIKRKDGSNQLIHLAEAVTIETSGGRASAADLKIGDRVTLVGGPNADGSFTADTVVVCRAPALQAQ